LTKAQALAKIQILVTNLLINIMITNVKILKSAPILDNAIKENSSDHEPIVVKVEV
jgi:hypothetical protein